MPSISDSRQPYRLSNFDLVTESLTFIAGHSSSPHSCIWYRRCTPVVVSSVTPRMPLAISVHFLGLATRLFLSSPRNTFHSSLALASGAGTLPAFSNSTPLCTSMVASPPSSRIMFGPLPSGQVSACSVHHQYSPSASPSRANPDTPKESWWCTEQ